MMLRCAMLGRTERTRAECWGWRPEESVVRAEEERCELGPCRIAGKRSLISSPTSGGGEVG